MELWSHLFDDDRATGILAHAYIGEHLFELGVANPETSSAEPLTTHSYSRNDLQLVLQSQRKARVRF